MGVVNMDRWLGSLMILAWVMIWVSFVFNLYLWSGFVFVFGPCFFSFFCLCCCDLGLSFWLLDLCSRLLGLIWEEHEELWVCVCVWSLFLFFFLFHLCCCDLVLSFWLLDLCSWLLGLIWEEHDEQVAMFLWKIIMISNNVLLLGCYSFAWVWFVVIFWKKKKKIGIKKIHFN